ncbi:hypothetical protein RJT34_27132 [Clitoria ternatea]|uniref:SKP1-like protein n=1 Tax=Clitoria ternatea TaxID=43366 RepID=A0AAN9IBX9_CLITE
MNKNASEIETLTDIVDEISLINKEQEDSLIKKEQEEPQIKNLTLNTNEANEESKINTEDRENEKKIILKTSDGTIFEVEMWIVKKMQIVQSFMDADGTVEASEIPLPKVSGKEMARILEYMRKHGDGGDGDHSEFDEQFGKSLNGEELKELFLVANYLDVKEVFDFLTQLIADFIANKNVKFVREYFGIQSNFTPDEEATLRRDNAWAFNDIEED